LPEVLGEAAVAAEPCKGPLDDPASGQYLEAFGVVGPLDDLDRSFPDLAQRLAQLVSGMATIGEDVPEPGVTAYDLCQDERCTIAILHVSGVNDGMHQIALGVGHDVPLAPLDLLARIIAARPAALRRLDALAVASPYFVSITPVLGEASRPPASRPISSRA